MIEILYSDLFALFFKDFYDYFKCFAGNENSKQKISNICNEVSETWFQNKNKNEIKSNVIFTTETQKIIGFFFEFQSS